MMEKKKGFQPKVNIRPTTFGPTIPPAMAVGLFGPKFVGLVNNARETAEGVHRDAEDRVRDLRAILARELSTMGLVGFLWVRPEGRVDTLFTDETEEAVDRFVEGSGVTLVMVQRVEGEAVHQGQIDLIRAAFPELEVRVKSDRPRCGTCGKLVSGDTEDVGDLCECHTCDRCGSFFQTTESDWMDTNMTEDGEVLCSDCMDRTRKGTVWKCPNCGHLFNDMGDVLTDAMIVVQGTWVGEWGHWFHNCTDGTRHEGITGQP